MLTVLQGIFQSRNYFTFLPMVRNLIFGTFSAAVFGLWRAACHVQSVLTGHLCFSRSAPC